MEEKHNGELKHKIQKFMTDASNLLELITAAIVFVAVLLALIRLLPEISDVWTAYQDSSGFVAFLGRVFNIVIGIEFLKMLCHPNSDNILEIMIFLIARHMVISGTTPVEDLISTISIVILCLVRYLLKVLEGKKILFGKNNHNASGQRDSGGD